jgi:Outer membrane protein beta-barrel family/Carboxypeptidase regulatory-like domain
MKKAFAHLFVLFLLLNYGQLLAQGSIIGELRDNKNQPMPSQPVNLVRANDSALVKITLTDDNGKFEFDQLKKGSYRLIISSLGFKKHVSPPLSISGQNPVVVPPIDLQNADAKELGAVTVTAQKPFIERKIDRTIVNVDALISNAGQTAWDILEKSPNVRTDEKGTITLKGKDGVMILVDDKPTYLSGEALMNYLKSLPSGSLDKLELMTNPPAKYDAAGNAGVINIRTKRSLLRGTNGNFVLSFGQGIYPKANNSFNFSHRDGKINVFGTIGNTLATGFSDLTIERKFLNTQTSFIQHSDIRRVIQAVNGRVGLDYYASKNTTVGILATGLTRQFQTLTFNDAYFKNRESAVDSTILADNSSKDGLKNAGLNLNLRHQAKAGREFSVDADYLTYRTESDQVFKNSSYQRDFVLVQAGDILGNLPTDLDIFSLKTDYTHPLSNGVKLEAGLKTSLIKTRNNAQYNDRIAGKITPNYTLTNEFLYRENINAAYINANTERGRWGFQAGLRAENTQLVGNQLGNPQVRDSSFRRDYTSLFPTVFLSYKADTLDRHQWGFSYSRRIERPFFQDLNPFILPLDKYTFYAGNPYLLPVFSNNFEISHTYKGVWTTSFEYSFVNNIITETLEFVGVTYYSRPNNLASRATTSLQMSGNLPLSKKWSCIIGGELTRLDIKSDLYGLKIDTFGHLGFLNVNNIFQLGKGWSAELGAWVRSSALFSQIKTVGQWQMSMGVQKKVLKNKGTVRFSLSDPFYTRINAGTIYFLRNTAASYTNFNDTRVGTLTFSYNFSKGSGMKAPRKTGGADEEKNRVKQ